MFFSNHIKGTDYTSTIEAAAGYEGVIGSQIAMYECVQNDFTLFTAALTSDFHEVTMVQEGQSEEAIAVFTEGVLSDMWNKLKELFKKLWAKIKAIFEGFIAKFNSVFMKSSKEFATKYKAQLVNKNLSKMKAKYSKEKDFKKLVTLEGNQITVEVESKENAKEILEDFEADEQTCYYINNLLSTGKKFDDLKTFSKDFHEACFDDEEEKEGFDDIKISLIGLLTDADKTESDLKKAKGKLEKQINEIIKQIDKAQTEHAKKYPTDGSNPYVKNAKRSFSYKEDFDSLNEESGHRRNRTIETYKDSDSYAKSDAYNNRRADMLAIDADEEFRNDSSNRPVKAAQYTHILSLAQRRSSCAQSAITKVTGAVLTEHKFRVSQAKRIIAKAVAYNDKAKNEATMLDAIEEVAFYEAMEELK